MKEGHYFIDETAFQKKENLRDKFGKTYNISVTDKGTEAKVFVFELGEFLISENFPLLWTDKTINGKTYIPVYVENYIKGQEYFQKTFFVTSDTLFKNPDPFIKNLHYCFYHAEPIKKKYGWEHYEESYPIIISENAVAEYGFYAGILFEFKEFKDKYSTLFKDFEKNCPLELPANNHKTYSHREHILANKFKAKVNIEKEKTASEWKAERGNNAKNQYYTVIYSKNAKNYKAPTVKELKNVIELLEDFPEAQKIAINNKEQLENL